MPTQTTQRRSSTAYRNRVYTDSSRQRGSYSQARLDAARVYERPVTYPDRPVTVRPRTQTGKQAPVKAPERPRKTAKSAQMQRAGMIKIFLRIALVVGLCMLMLGRYATILERSDRIEKLTAEVAAIEAKNQSIQAKIDRGLELSALEEYATGKLGMIHPDSSQMFYIDMQMGDATQSKQGEEPHQSSALQGTPGALVHAIQVLK